MIKNYASPGQLYIHHLFIFGAQKRLQEGRSHRKSWIRIKPPKALDANAAPTLALYLGVSGEARKAVKFRDLFFKVSGCFMLSH